ncbi:unnamed protein product [[Actinomadura] parvosata subsp. kistnae]|nr:unnamed protein product [Actinomadura parvosata subsp. kistnae]
MHAKSFRPVHEKAPDRCMPKPRGSRPVKTKRALRPYGTEGPLLAGEAVSRP